MQSRLGNYDLDHAGLLLDAAAPVRAHESTSASGSIRQRLIMESDLRRAIGTRTFTFGLELSTKDMRRARKRILMYLCYRLEINLSLLHSPQWPNCQTACSNPGTQATRLGTQTLGLGGGRSQSPDEDVILVRLRGVRTSQKRPEIDDVKSHRESIAARIMQSSVTRNTEHGKNDPGPIFRHE